MKIDVWYRRLLRKGVKAIENGELPQYPLKGGTRKRLLIRDLNSRLKRIWRYHKIEQGTWKKPTLVKKAANGRLP